MPDDVDDRIPPAGGSGTAPPRAGWTVLPNGPHITTELAAIDHLIAHLRAEVDRLTAAKVAAEERAGVLLRGEREHNRRLMAAVSLYRSAAEVGATSLGNVRDGDSHSSFTVESEQIGSLIIKADDLVIPTAEES